MDIYVRKKGWSNLEDGKAQLVSRWMFTDFGRSLLLENNEQNEDSTDIDGFSSTNGFDLTNINGYPHLINQRYHIPEYFTTTFGLVQPPTRINKLIANIRSFANTDVLPPNIGDIVYYKPSFKSYVFGHTALLLGEMKLNDKFRLIFTAETGGGSNYIRKFPFTYDDLYKSSYTKIRKHIDGYSGLVGSACLIKPYCSYKNMTMNPNITVIRYIGPFAEIIRPAAAMIAYYLITGLYINYGWSLLNICFGIGKFNINDVINNYIVPLYEGKRVKPLVCSGFVIICYQIAMILLDMSDICKKYIGYNAASIRPTGVAKLLTLHPDAWIKIPFEGNYCEPTEMPTIESNPEYILYSTSIFNY